MKSIYKIGITINFDKNFFSNGLQQNIVFLQRLFNEIDNFKAFYLWEGNSINENFINKDDCIKYSDLLKEEANSLDFIIMMGFTINDKTINQYRKKHIKSKFILLQCGNQYVENMNFALFSNDNKHTPVERLQEADQIWVTPHYKKNIPFMKAFYKNENVFSVPYIWDSLFLDYQINKSIYKDKEFDFFSLNEKNILVMEPNLNSSKNCILPLYIMEAFEHKFPNTIETLNIFCGNNLIENEYFIKMILQMDIYNLRKGLLKVHKRVTFLNAIHKFGSIIISHQQDNALNYLYLESLYLNLPLLHNSKMISDTGYFYPDNDTEIARDQLHRIIKLHKKNIQDYKLNSMKILEKFSYKNSSNKKNYLNLIYNLIK